MSMLAEFYIVEYACHTSFNLYMKKNRYNLALAMFQPCRNNLDFFYNNAYTGKCDT
jgi:hypothetical protein